MIVAPGPFEADPARLLSGVGWWWVLGVYLLVFVSWAQLTYLLFYAYNQFCRLPPVYQLLYRISYCWAWLTRPSVRHHRLAVAWTGAEGAPARTQSEEGDRRGPQAGQVPSVPNPRTPADDLDRVA